MSDKIDFNTVFGNKYEKFIELALPTYHQLFPMVESILKKALGDKTNLLIVGSGGGKELVEFASSNSNWKLTGIDPAEKMVEIARRKVRKAGLENRVKLLEGVVHDLPEEKAYDGATCILVSHFISGAESQRALFKSIAERMKPGSPFVLVSLFGEKGTAEFERCFHAWKYNLSNKIGEGKTEDFFEKGMESINFMPEAKIKGLLEEVGFCNITNFFTTYLFGGWFATVK